jgi:hypothetical protein
MRPAGRALIGLWVTILLLAGSVALLLALLGPPKPATVRLAAADAPKPVRPARPPSVPARPAPIPVPVARPQAVAAMIVAAPDPALLEPAPDFPDRSLPRIGTDGRTPSRVYASHAGLPAHGAQVAILLEGLGLSDAISHDAIEHLPAAISLGVSPYAASVGRAGLAPLLDAARDAGHETWLSLPMEPAGSPLDDEGAEALTTAIDFDLDRHALEWSLSRLQGYVGVTNALSGLRGDRFANSTAFSMVTRELDTRGLLYVDAGTAAHDAAAVPVAASSRRADLTIDEQLDATDIEARLSRLEQIASTQGSALGVAGPLRPVVVERLRAWSQHLAARGIALVPVSALPGWKARPDAPPTLSGAAPVPAAPAPVPAPAPPPAPAPAAAPVSPSPSPASPT